MVMVIKILTEGTKAEVDASTSSLLLNDNMMIELMNTMFLLEKPNNADYSRKRFISPDEIQETISRYTKRSRNMTSLQFAQWVDRNKRHIYWTQHIVTRPTKKDTDKRVRDLYILERKQHDNVATFIEKQIPYFQEQMQLLKNSGEVVVGYCRKSDSNETHDARFRSIQLMIYQLIDRCHVHKVFVSPKSNPYQPLMNRDKTLCKRDLQDLNSVDGTTKDMVSFIKSSTKKVSIVVLGFKGFTTNVNDLNQFLMETDNVNNIIVDQLPVKYEILFLNREELIADHSSIISMFDSTKTF